ncbi:MULTISPECIES: bifunctional 4-hydroxy-2-oxoglutarate aldolase/2-dehydro-3-deoxy-phosphogluconate aldolase [unclassified Sphingobacterium]|uniref:bifunctional 4-hydroxy-2-oxoglutarate aldolase/2-dehydro-3-deoxy-phosphogluconate aldolase n=1 Tax=unclassified Sphingobacterium TaxID=2609468 RepID=UPI0025F2F7D8|nr:MULTISPECIES: bifunctional 4-hydroxy-2-oxoglutarate aldolase/2-dehydro-3-deoxy-phosphogluconate aldolase [unclassified Sphingobacterium]
MNEVLKLIGDSPVIPVYYNDNIDSCIDVLTKCYKGGIRVFEFVNRGVNAKENFKQLLAFKNEHFPDLKLGIGTIKTGEQAKEFIALGAEFIVSPIIKKKIAEITAKHGLLWIPGCMTPTEIAKAEELGTPLVKLFPGDSLGPNFLKAIKPLFPELKFMPTGGVDTTEENICTWRQAGVYAVGLGSKLFSPPSDGSGEDWLSERCQLLLKWSKA